MNLNGGKFFGDRYAQYVDELTAEGTLGGQKLTPDERKEGFKKRGNKIAFNTFVDKVMAKKTAAGGGGIGGGTGGVGSLSGGVRPAQRLLGPAAVGDEPVPPGLDSLIAEIQGGDQKKRQKSLLDYVKQINNKVGTLLSFFEKDTEARKEDAAEQARLLEKQDRAEKERKKEGMAGKIAKPAFLSKLTAPLSNIFNDIVKTFLILLAGWGIDKIFKWLQDPANTQKVEDFKEFITVALPKVLKGILAIVALGIGAKILKFAIMIGKGAAMLLKNLLKLGKNLVRFAMKNPKIALALGIGALAVAAVRANRPGTATVPDPEDPDRSQMDEINEFGGMTGAPISGDMLGFRGGGMARGTDIVPAMLSPGEFIMSKGAVDMYGADTLASMNADGGGTNRPKKLGGMVYASGGGQILGGAKQIIGMGAGVGDQCANTTRAALRAAGHPAANKVTQIGDLDTPKGTAYNAPSFAASFGGTDMGKIITNKSEIKAGDIILWRADRDKGGIINKGAITHVGIAADDGLKHQYDHNRRRGFHYRPHWHSYASTSWFAGVRLGGSGGQLPGSVSNTSTGAPEPGDLRVSSSAGRSNAAQLTAGVPISIKPIGRGLNTAPAASAGSSSAAAAGSIPPGSASVPGQGLFSPIDQNNLSMLVVKSMYNIIE
jgi:hypothetical protein